jgi:lipid-binding SYLF domain-containing protein
VSDINADENANRAFYDPGKANPGAILSGQVKRRSRPPSD